MGMEARYHWNLTQPGDNLAIHMENHARRQKYFDATMTLRRRDHPARTQRTLLKYPLMTCKVIAAIYWQALQSLAEALPVLPAPQDITPDGQGA
jgi:DUF1365 family protein